MISYVVHLTPQSSSQFVSGCLAEEERHHHRRGGEEIPAQVRDWPQGKHPAGDLGQDGRLG